RRRLIRVARSGTVARRPRRAVDSRGRPSLTDQSQHSSWCGEQIDEPSGSWDASKIMASHSGIGTSPKLLGGRLSSMEPFDEYRRRPRGPMPSEAWQRYLPLFPWVVGLFLALWLMSDLSYTVKPYEQAVVLRFGKYHATTMPGLHFKLPLVDQVMKVSVEEHGLRLPFGLTSRTEDPINAKQLLSEDETLMLTGDLNTASVEWTVQWKVTEPKDFLFRFPQDEN